LNSNETSRLKELIDEIDAEKYKDEQLKQLFMEKWNVKEIKKCETSTT
jgi:hypothetical protein